VLLFRVRKRGRGLERGLGGIMTNNLIIIACVVEWFTAVFVILKPRFES